MGLEATFDWTAAVGDVILGATNADGGTRKCSYRIGGGTTLPFIGGGSPAVSPLIAFEVCDNRQYWNPVVLDYCGDITSDPAAWAAKAETSYGADMIHLNLTSTKARNFSDIPMLGKTVESLLSSTGLPLIIEGSNEPKIDSEVFQRCGEAGQGERLLLGTAEASRYRSIAAAALAYNHSVIAQSPIDINLAKQLNILLREIGVTRDHIIIDPYTGALGYGFEYSFSAMERIRFSALKGDTDLAMPMICAPTDTLTIKEVRDAEGKSRDDIAVQWEVYTSIAAAAAGAEIICVRHPRSVGMLKQAFCDLKSRSPAPGVS
jgi:acetyl-CoA decarbonylase/synthase complex subunit delta